MVPVILVLLAPLLAPEPQSFEPQSFDSTYKAGLVALQNNDLAAAQSNLEAAAKLQPANARVWVALADLNLKMKRRDEADHAAARAETLAPNDPVVAQVLAVFYSQTDRPLKAAEFEMKYAAANPSDRAAIERAAEWYFAASEPLLKQQKFAEALAILEPATKKIPSNAQLQLALGVADYGLRRFDDAAGHFLKTIDIDPGIRQPYVFLSKFLDQAPGRTAEIAARARSYRESHSEDELGFLLEAKALDAANAKPDEARELLRKAIELSPSDAAAHTELGALEERMRNFTTAAAEFEHAAALDASDPAAHYHLARIYDRLGQPDRARAEREKHAKLIAAQEVAR